MEMINICFNTCQWRSWE